MEIRRSTRVERRHRDLGEGFEGEGRVARARADLIVLTLRLARARALPVSSFDEPRWRPEIVSIRWPPPRFVLRPEAIRFTESLCRGVDHGRGVFSCCRNPSEEGKEGGEGKTEIAMVFSLVISLWWILFERKRGNRDGGFASRTDLWP
ncbi:unnamed protein product [Xylocopa violacea]|uniref:Uncharacterized protein n=1 Tax=Xylocopa violacea TaxID=135666 RepID=A0ABP1N9I5_XYLVO